MATARTVAVWVVALGLAACGKPSDGTASRGVLSERTAGEESTAVFRDLRPLSLDYEQFKLEGNDTLFVTCGINERIRAEQAVISTVGGETTPRHLVVPDTGCLLWAVLVTHATLPVSIYPDSIRIVADTALVYARFDDSRDRSDAPMRPGLVLLAPRRVSRVRMDLFYDHPVTTKSSGDVRRLEMRSRRVTP